MTKFLGKDTGHWVTDGKWRDDIAMVNGMDEVITFLFSCTYLFTGIGALDLYPRGKENWTSG